MIESLAFMALTLNLSMNIDEGPLLLPTQITFSDATFNGSVLGLQDALSSSSTEYYSSSSTEYYDYYSQPPDVWPFIFLGTCPVKDDRPNCTAACLDPSFVFANLTNTHNCLVYSLISDLHAREQLSVGTEMWADELGIEAYFLNSSSSNAILDTIQICLWDYCKNLKGCPDWISQRYGSGDTSENSTDPSEIYNLQSVYWIPAYANASGICSQISAPANEDIGGVGVYWSYSIQSGIALLAYLSMVFWDLDLLYVISNLRFIVLATPSEYEKAKDKVRKTCNQRREKRLGSLTSALTDFQKAQCFLMLAINCAALRVVYKGGLDPTSLQELYNTHVFIRITSISGYLPVTFTLFTLHRVRKVSWYLLILSMSTVAVSTVTLFTTGEFHPAQNDFETLQLLARTGGPITCASMNPMTYCLTALGGGVLSGSQLDEESSYSTGSSIDVSNGAVQMLGWCLLVLAYLVGDTCRLSWIARRPRSTLQVEDTMAFYTWVPGHLAAAPFKVFQGSSVRRLTTKILKNLWPNAAREKIKAEVGSLIQHFGATERRKMACRALIHTAVFVVYLYWFAIFLRDLSWFGQIGGYSDSWSFGQIVAITVWVGPLCEYLHLEIRGMERGFDHRLLSPYRVTKQPEKTDEVKAGIKALVSGGAAMHDEGHTRLYNDSSSLPAEHSKDDPEWTLPVLTVSSEQSAHEWSLRRRSIQSV